LICGYCERQGDLLRVIPHPDALNQHVLQFRCPGQALVLGRVTHVASLLP
jgi:hypothetical protein